MSERRKYDLGELRKTDPLSRVKRIWRTGGTSHVPWPRPAGSNRSHQKWQRWHKKNRVNPLNCPLETNTFASVIIP